jgi:hypothetical protein
MQLIWEDIKFLGAHRLMDYSLLLIIEEYEKWSETRSTAAKKKGEEKNGLDAIEQVEAAENLVMKSVFSTRTD